MVSNPGEDSWKLRLLVNNLFEAKNLFAGKILAREYVFTLMAGRECR